MPGVEVFPHERIPERGAEHKLDFPVPRSVEEIVELMHMPLKRNQRTVDQLVGFLVPQVEDEIIVSITNILLERNSERGGGAHLSSGSSLPHVVGRWRCRGSWK